MPLLFYPEKAMTDTIFHQIINGDIPAAKIYEDKYIFVFMDAFPQTKGHALIVPKNFAPDLLTIDDNSLTHIIKFSQKLARAQKKALGADGIRVVQYNGAAAGQTVFYYHMHLIPMWDGKSPGAHGKGAADITELKEIAALIAAELE